MTVYLLHADKRIGGAGKLGAQHYLGFVEDWHLWNRLALHQSGRSGAKIINAFLAAGATLYLVRVWEGMGRAGERHMKSRGHLPQRCPVCNGILTLKDALSLVTAQRYLTQPAELRTSRLRQLAGQEPSSGTTTPLPGPSTQGLLPVANTKFFTSSGWVPTSPGGSDSSAPARQRAPGATSVGTRQRSSSGGSQRASPAETTSSADRLSRRKSPASRTADGLYVRSLLRDFEP